MVSCVPRISAEEFVKLRAMGPGERENPGFINSMLRLYVYTTGPSVDLKAIKAWLPTMAAAVGLMPHPTHPPLLGAASAITITGANELNYKTVIYV
jgi:hypothetical protein